MNTTTAGAHTQETTSNLLCAFVRQRAGLDFANYGDVSSYRSEARQITKDKAHFFELFALASRRYGSNFESALTNYLTRSSGRLTLSEGRLQYCTGQYFPTEYRKAACAVLASLIFADFRDEKESNTPNNLYKDGHEIRKAIKRALSRGAYSNYFN